MTTIAAPALPRCWKCGQPGEVPIRPHGVALCLSCYLEDQRVTVELSREPAA